MSTVSRLFRKAYIALSIIISSLFITGALAINRFGKSFIKPISQIINGISTIAEHSDLTERTILDRNDELGDLASNFNILIDNFHNVMKSIDEIAQSLSASSKEFVSVSEKLAQTKTNITTIVSDVINSISDISARISVVSAERTNIFKEITKDIQNLHSGLQTVSEQATTTLSLSENVVELAKQGEVSISGVNTSMNNVLKTSTDMSKIIGIIDDISDRINLLSLNASIEAARAGESGRGFAVVADEISKLADQTANSTKSIDVLIKKNNSEIANEMKFLEDTTNAFKNIIDGIQRMKPEISKINLMTISQKGTAEKAKAKSNDIEIKGEEIKQLNVEEKQHLNTANQAIITIENYVADIAINADEISTGSGVIRQNSHLLNKKVSVFKV
jgi:methyl-accepting chemotaxis protein